MIELGRFGLVVVGRACEVAGEEPFYRPLHWLVGGKSSPSSGHAELAAWGSTE
jgi:hypothetical protein